MRCITLILGGARSGKSARAEVLAKKTGKQVTYLATSPDMDDGEWKLRVKMHQDTRPKHWQTVEETLDICGVLQAAQPDQCVLIDCLTLWLSNLMFEHRDVAQEVSDLCAILKACQVDVIVVSNEVGMGLVPENELGRAFRDAQGRLNQAVAEIADTVEFVVAGLPMTLKSKS